MSGIQRSFALLAAAALAGQLYDMDNTRVIGLANSNSTKELWTITVDSAADSEYTLDLTTNLGLTASAAYDQGAAGTVENKVDGLVEAATNALSQYGVKVVKTSTSTFTIEGRTAQVGAFTVVASAQMTAVNTTDAESDTAIPFGRGVVYADSIGLQCKLPATLAEKNLYSVLVGGATDGTYILEIEGETITYTASTAGSAAVVRDGLIDLIRDSYALRDSVRAYVKDADELYIEAINPGVAISVAADNTTGTGSDLTVTEANEEVAGDVFAGVAMLSHSQANDTKYDLAGVREEISGTQGYAAGAEVNVVTRGVVWVETEEAVSVGQPVYVRAVAGASEAKGKFRKSADSTDCILLERARWVRGNTAAGLAVLEVW